MRSAAHELALYLEAQGVGTFATDLFVGREPDSPDNAVTLYDTGGLPPVSYEIALRQPAIQVRVRNRDYAAAVDKHNEVFNVLNGLLSSATGIFPDEGATLVLDFVNEVYTQWQPVFYLGVYLTSDILSLGRDEKERNVLTANYQVQRGQS